MSASQSAARRWLATVLVSAMLIVATAPVASASAGPSAAEQAEELLIERTVEERQRRGLSTLEVDADLTDVARRWSARMASEGRLAHNPDYAEQVPFPWTRLGENVGYSRVPNATVVDLAGARHEAFMASAGHRRQILGDYDRIGVGVSAPRQGVVWVTVAFARAASEAPPPKPLSRPLADDAEEAITGAIAASQEVFADGAADRIVLARGDVFADALAAAPLVGDAGPVLFTWPGERRAELDPRVADEIDRALADDGLVYVVGGGRAVASDVERALGDAGHPVRRLAGHDRIDTALEIAGELERRGGEPETVVLAVATEWADAAVGGAWAASVGAPIVLTDGDRLDGRVAAYLAERDPASRWALGGTAALSETTVEAAGARRVAGADRSETSVVIARELWGCTASQPCPGFHIVRGDKGGGWARALAATAGSVEEGLPQLLVADPPPVSVLDYLRSVGGQGGRLTVDPDVGQSALETLERTYE